MPGQITQFVLKVHSRCDLACDHCYVFEHADQSWRRKPRSISPATVHAAAARMAEHAASHGLREIKIILHGGEPLLIGRDGMRVVLDTLVTTLGPVASIDLRLHTNGLQLDEKWCRLFSRYHTRIGVSLDGGKAANDRHRRFADGRSSYQETRKALALLRRPQFRHLYAGILCTIDIDNDPIAVYESLIAEEPPNLDLLLPHATWEQPPKRPAGATEPYAAWLTQIYRRWISDGRPVPIRIFDSLTSAARGGTSKSETFGLDPVDLLVIDTDGSWEQPDSLKTAFDGAPDTGMRVFTDPVDDVAAQPGFVTRSGGRTALCATCQNCEFVQACGGGLYAHRYRADTGFDNPTVYCADMKALIWQITSVPAVARAEPALATHRLAAEAFDALAAGPGTVDAIQTLAQMQLSFSRALVASVARSDSRWQDQDLRRAAADGWDLLCAIEAEHPAAVAEVLAHPYTLAWAERCLRPAADGNPDLDRAQLAGLAAATAIRAGRIERVALPVRETYVFVPTIGALKVDVATGTVATVLTGVDRITIPGQRGSWLPTRRLTDGLLQVALEDLDPLRDCHHFPAAARRTPAQWRTWQADLRAAGQRLTATVPGYASVLGAGLRAVVPLRQGARGDRSATAAQAFGAVALAPTKRPDGLHELLLHEFQHVKLHALTNLHDLFDRSDQRRIKVPWRPDPRPIEGALHGTYAYLALTHLWRASGPAWQARSAEQRDWVRSVADQLADADVLTADGQRFVAGMSAAAEQRLGH
jgi:uncharacterized protein